MGELTTLFSPDSVYGNLSKASAFLDSLVERMDGYSVMYFHTSIYVVCGREEGRANDVYAMIRASIVEGNEDADMRFVTIRDDILDYVGARRVLRRASLYALRCQIGAAEPPTSWKKTKREMRKSAKRYLVDEQIRVARQLVEAAERRDAERLRLISS